MKKLFLPIITILAAAAVNAQPCKVIKVGMTVDEVIKVAGQPTRIDTVGVIPDGKGQRAMMFLFQYGDPTKAGNQRVEFRGGKVNREVIAEGKKYDELQEKFARKEISVQELESSKQKINQDYCK